MAESRGQVRPRVMIMTERRMHEHLQSTPERRAQDRDGEVAAPRTDGDVTAPWRPVPTGSGCRAVGPL